MADRASLPPPSSRDVAGEDFLFHLYRGSELLQDNRVHEAKNELEQALNLQPSDPKGQDLLGIVYFRLGLYPRAIAIYERLIQSHPEAVEPRINLALSYLKTGQPAQARVELERVLEHSPGHARAWGYLGLSFQRLGDLERAAHAFAAGGHDVMAKRVLEMTTAAAPSLRPEGTQEQAEIRKAAGEAFQEIERTDGGFRSDDGPVRTPSGMWSAIEPGREPMPGAGVTPSLGGRTPSGSWSALVPPVTLGSGASPSPMPSAPRPPAGSEPPRAMRSTPPMPASRLARDMLVVFPRDERVALHGSGLVLVQAIDGFAVRLDAIRAMSFPGGHTTRPLTRRMRGKATDEPLGGVTSPVHEISGRGELVLGPGPGQRLVAVLVDDEPVYIREELLVGFESCIGYENGRFAVGDGEALPMIQLRGAGAASLALPASAASLEVAEGRTAVLRGLSVLGWVGRVLPRALSPTEAPGSARGFVALSGEGMVLVDAR